MKKLVVVFTVFLLVVACKTTYETGQCNQLFLDIEKGTLNGVSGTTSIEKIKKAFPCFTGETEEGSEFNCGGGIFFLDHDFYFYTHRVFIEVRNDFKGKISYPVLGITKEKLFKKFGEPDLTVSNQDYFDENVFTFEYEYIRKWGVLSFNLDDGVIVRVQCHPGKTVGKVDHCF